MGYTTYLMSCNGTLKPTVRQVGLYIKSGSITIDGGLPDQQVASASLWNSKTTRLTADGIYTGTITADQITTGTLNASLVNVINLNASNITTGTLTGIRLSQLSGGSGVDLVNGSIKLYYNNQLNIDIYPRRIVMYDDGTSDPTPDYGQIGGLLAGYRVSDPEKRAFFISCVKDDLALCLGTDMSPGYTHSAFLALQRDSDQIKLYRTIDCGYHSIINANQLSCSILSASSTVSCSYVIASTTSLCTNLNADLLDGMHASSSNLAYNIVARDASGNFNTNKISVNNLGAIGSGIFFDNSIGPSVDNAYVCGDSVFRWKLVRGVTITSGDLGFEEKTCPVCDRPFVDGDILLLLVKNVHDYGTLTIPIHEKCKGIAKTLTFEVPEMVDEYILDEDGTIKTVRVEKTVPVEKTIFKLKPSYVFNKNDGKFYNADGVEATRDEAKVSEVVTIKKPVYRKVSVEINREVSLLND